MSKKIPSGPTGPSKKAVPPPPRGPPPRAKAPCPAPPMIQSRAAGVAIASKIAQEYNDARALKKLKKARSGAKKEKKKGGFLHALKGAAKFAVKIAPSVLPMFLANHGPTVQAVASAGGYGVGSAAPSIAGVPVATGSTFGSEVGLKGFDVKKTGGKVTGVTMSGCDFLGTVSGTGAISAGDLLRQYDLNPMSADWAGTRLQRELSLWTKFRPTHYAFCCEPIAPTLTAGQFGIRCVTDPDQPAPAPGFAGIQELMASEGAEMFPVWQVGTANYYPAGNNVFFAKPYGSDKRLVSPGLFQMVATSDIAYADALTAVYVCWEIEAEIPLLDVGFSVPLYLAVQANPPSGTLWSLVSDNPFADYTGSVINYGLRPFPGSGAITPIGLPPNSLPFNWFTPVPVGPIGPDTDQIGWLTGLPVGCYLVQMQFSSTGFTPDGAWFWQPSPIGAEVLATNFECLGTFPEDSSIGVNGQTILVTITQQGQPEDPTTGAFSVRLQAGSGGLTPNVFLNMTVSRIPNQADVAALTLQDYEQMIRSLSEDVTRLKITAERHERRAAAAAAPASATSTAGGFTKIPR